MTTGNLYRVTNEDAPVYDATVEYVGPADPHPFAMFLGLAGENGEYRLTEITPEIQAEFDAAFPEGAPENVDIHTVYLYESEVEPVGAAA